MWLPVLLWIALSAAPAPARLARDAETVRLLTKIAVELDNTSRETLNDLARKGDQESFDALVMAIDWLSAPDTLSDAYAAFWFFRKSRELSRRAVDYLTGQALNSEHARWAAVYPLSFFGDAGHAALVLLLRESKDRD